MQRQMTPLTSPRQLATQQPITPLTTPTPPRRPLSRPTPTARRTTSRTAVQRQTTPLTIWRQPLTRQTPAARRKASRAPTPHLAPEQTWIPPPTTQRPISQWPTTQHRQQPPGCLPLTASPHGSHKPERRARRPKQNSRAPWQSRAWRGMVALPRPMGGTALRSSISVGAADGTRAAACGSRTQRLVKELGAPAQAGEAARSSSSRVRTQMCLLFAARRLMRRSEPEMLRSTSSSVDGASAGPPRARRPRQSLVRHRVHEQGAEP